MPPGARPKIVRDRGPDLALLSLSIATNCNGKEQKGISGAFPTPSFGALLPYKPRGHNSFKGPLLRNETSGPAQEARTTHKAETASTEQLHSVCVEQNRRSRLPLPAGRVATSLRARSRRDGAGNL